MSFIGAGTIIRRVFDSDSEVAGPTTVATLLMSVAIGICVALSGVACRR